jgi:type I restriction enzyme S subunit
MSAKAATEALTGLKKLPQRKDAASAADTHPDHDFQKQSSPEEMKELPASWKVVRLGDIAKTTSGGTPRRDRPNFYTGKIPWVKSGELGDSVVYETTETITQEAIESSNAKIFPKGTLCIALYGATVGKLGILGIDAATNQAVCAIFPPEELDTRYLYRFFESKRRELVAQGKGGAQPNISQGIIRDTQVPFPPLPEQRRIVAEIEKQFTRVEAGVAALRRVQVNLKRYRSAVLKAACEGQLVPTEAELSRKEGRTYETGEQLLKRILAERPKNWSSRGKYKEPAAPDAANLLPLPEGWTWARVEQISTKVVDGVHKKPNYVPSGIPFVTVRNLTAGPGISFEKLNYVTEQDHDEFIKRANPELGDILVSKDGTLGVIRVVKTDVKFSIFVSVAMVKPVLRQMSDFLGHALSSSQVQAQMVPKGSGLQHIHLEDLREDCLPLPPLAEQTRIVAEVERRLSVVEELESVVSANLQRATRLRQNILQKAFTGEL